MPLKVNSIPGGKPHPGVMGIWIQAIRPYFVPTSIFPALLGSVIAWSRFREFHLGYFLLVIVGVALHHMGLNMIDDVFDHLHSVDRSQGEEKNPYTGGSGVLTGGLLTVRQVLSASILCYLTGIAIALYLTLMVGWPVLLFVAIGIFSSLFYTIPPIRYGYRGLGELSLLINFGPVICLGAFYVQTRSIAWEPFILSLIPGFLMWSMIVINEIPDYEEDRQAGKRTLVVRVGRKRAIALYVAGLTGAYATMLLSAGFGATSFSVLLGLLTLPLACRSFRILKDHYLDKIKMVPANLAMIKVHALTMSGLIIGYLAEGIVFG